MEKEVTLLAILQELRDFRKENNTRLEVLENRLDRLEGRETKLDERMSRMESKMETLEDKMLDLEKKTVIMHAKDGQELDIRETDRVIYTLSNILDDGWILADEENCPELGGVATFGFDEAIKYLKRGMRLARKGWNGKGMYVFVGHGSDLTNCLSMGRFECISSLCLKTAQNKLCVGWVASQEDMLAEDWTFVEEN